MAILFILIYFVVVIILTPKVPYCDIPIFPVFSSKLLSPPFFDLETTLGPSLHSGLRVSQNNFIVYMIDKKKKKKLITIRVANYWARNT